jgi:AcrR family transcriptional regulator
MMAAACQVFSERGFSKTTMDAVAGEAGVAVQTLYFTFHTKSELLQAAYEYAVLGPDETPPHLSEWWRAVDEARDVRKAVVALVDGTIPILERAARLVWVVRADEDARATYEHNEELRRDGNDVLIGMLTAKKPLRKGLAPGRARDILLSFTGPYQFQLLTAEYGWSVAEYRDWVVQAVLRELFDAR